MKQTKGVNDSFCYPQGFKLEQASNRSKDNRLTQANFECVSPRTSGVSLWS